MTAALAESLVTAFAIKHPVDAVAALRALSHEDAAGVVFRRPPEASARLLSRMNPDDAVLALAHATDEAGKAALLGLDRSKCAGLFSRLDSKERERWSGILPKTVVDEISEILTYPPQTAGSVMDRKVSHFRGDDTVEQALTKLRELESRRIADLMLVDDDGRLVAMVPLQAVAAAPADTILASIAKSEPARVLPMTPQDELVELVEKHRLASVPVVDHDGHLMGVIRHDALVAMTHKEATADLQAMVGASKEERALSSPWTAIKSRLPWLQINLATAFLASAVVGLFDATIAQVTALAVLMPVVAGQSGNTGAQALAVTSRGLALREIRPSHWWRVVRKEAVVGATAGVAVAIMTALGVFLWSGNLPLAGVISVAMVMSMMLAAVAGAIIPIILTVLGRDPATASSILLTTVTDVVGFFSFLGLATVMVAALAGG